MLNNPALKSRMHPMTTLWEVVFHNAEALLLVQQEEAATSATKADSRLDTAAAKLVDQTIYPSKLLDSAWSLVHSLKSAAKEATDRATLASETAAAVAMGISPSCNGQEAGETHSKLKAVMPSQVKRRQRRNAETTADPFDVVPPSAAAEAVAKNGTLEQATDSSTAVGRQRILRSVVPAMSAVYSIDNEELVQAVISLFQDQVAAGLVCPCTCKSNSPDSCRAAACTDDGISFSGEINGDGGPSSRRRTGGHAMQTLVNVAAAASALLDDSGSSEPPASCQKLSLALARQLGVLAHAQLAGLRAAGPDLHLLLPLATGFQATTGIHPIASTDLLEGLRLSRPQACSAQGGTGGLGSSGSLRAGGMKAMLVAMMGCLAQLFVSASSGSSSEDAEETEELCACLQVLCADELGKWEEWHRQCSLSDKQQQQRQDEHENRQQLQPQQQPAAGAEPVPAPGSSRLHQLLPLRPRPCCILFEMGMLAVQVLEAAFPVAGPSEAVSTSGTASLLPTCVSIGLDAVMQAAVAAGGDDGPAAADRNASVEEFLQSGSRERQAALLRVEAQGGSGGGGGGGSGRSAASEVSGRKATAPGADVEVVVTPASLACRLVRVLSYHAGNKAVLLGLLERLVGGGGGGAAAGKGPGSRGSSDTSIKRNGSSKVAAAAGRADKLGAERLLLLVRAMYEGDVASLVSTCCSLLTPESNCPLEVRLMAISAVEAEVETELAELGLDQDAAHAAMWPHAALQALFFTLTHDPAVRVRRSAVRLLSLVALPQGGAQAEALCRVLLVKMRDRDAVVSSRAMGLVLQLPSALLHRCCSRHEWAFIVRDGLRHLAGQPIATPAERGKAAASSAMTYREGSAGAGRGGAAAGDRGNGRAGGGGRGIPVAASPASAAASAAPSRQPADDGFAHLFQAFFKRLAVSIKDAATASAAAGRLVGSEGGPGGEEDGGGGSDLQSCTSHPQQLLLSLGLEEQTLRKSLLRFKMLKQPQGKV